MFRSKNHTDSEPRPSGQSHNLAARMGRWSAAHWKTATFGWLGFVVVAFMLGGLVGTALGVLVTVSGTMTALFYAFVERGR